MRNFRTYQLSILFYRSLQSVQLPCHLQDQLRRAASSVSLTLAEGSGKRTQADQKRFFHMALGSAREIRAIADLNPDAFTAPVLDQLDHLSASIYKLTRWTV